MSAAFENESIKNHKMKKVYQFSTILAVITFLSACGLNTFHPIFKVNELAYDKRLLGTWNTDSRESITFAPASTLPETLIPPQLLPYKNNFFVQTKGDERTLAFLTKIGGNYYLDNYPLEDTPSATAFEKFFFGQFVKMHSISRVDFINSTSVKIRSVEQDYLEKLIQTKQVRIPYTVVATPENDDKKIVITASTEDLQKFIVKYGNDEKAYNNEDAIYSKTK
jgi:hypothetical protein